MPTSGFYGCSDSTVSLIAQSTKHTATTKTTDHLAMCAITAPSNTLTTRKR
jgi:hypothetical protein